VEVFTDYGVDTSYAIHHPLNPKTYWGQQYEKMMEGCYKSASKNQCMANDMARIEMNLDQPRTQHNYTDIGFKKIKAPKKLMDIILEFYNRNKGKESLEKWPAASIYVNHWDSPTYMLNFENSQFRGGFDIKQQIWAEAKPILEEWTNKKLTPTSLYGVRIYRDKAILATHVDRLPLVSSAIIQVDQDVDEPWPIEVYARDGKAYNVTMDPGDMVLYESHTTLHGRPFPLKGRFYANVFVHFAPLDHDEENENDPKLIALRNEDKRVFKSSHVVEAKKYLENALHPKQQKANKDVGGHEHDNHPKDAVARHMEDLARKEAELQNLHIKDPEAYKKAMEAENDAMEKAKDDENAPKGRTDLHFAAALGFVENVRKILNGHRTDIINARDENGWQAIHEAARGGHIEIVKYLIDLGADVKATTGNDETPLGLARSTLPKNHPLIAYLESIHAPEGVIVDEGAEEEEEYVEEYEDEEEEGEENQ
jgi:hypothetical protein